MIKKKMKMRFTAREILITIALALVIFLALQAMFQSVRVVGSSMEPSLEQGQYLLLSKASYWFHSPKGGDVIVFKHPEEPDRELIKRVIATPGDIVEIKDGKVYINDIPLEEDYISDPPSYIFPAQQVPEGYYFVLGDNRNHSSDSHIWSNPWIPEENIIGKAQLSYWPPSMWKCAPNHSLTTE